MYIVGSRGRIITCTSPWQLDPLIKKKKKNNVSLERNAAHRWPPRWRLSILFKGLIGIPTITWMQKASYSIRTYHTRETNTRGMLHRGRIVSLFLNRGCEARWIGYISNEKEKIKKSESHFYLFDKLCRIPQLSNLFQYNFILRFHSCNIHDAGWVNYI